jgi:hypothetical protein
MKYASTDGQDEKHSLHKKIIVMKKTRAKNVFIV